MANPILPCFMYTIYAFAYVMFTVFLEVDISSGMFSAIVQRFETVPWSQNPDLVLKDVHGGPQVHEWLTTVFLSQLYAADPSQNLDDGYCTEKYPCLLGEGNAHENNECAKYLTKGNGNCPSHMSAEAGCCEPCQAGSDCQNVTLRLRGDWKSMTTSTEDLTSACSNDMPSWLPLLEGWPQETAKYANIAQGSTSDIKFCPERLARVPQSAPMPIADRTLTIAGFNQVLAGRITMKRINLVSSVSPNFKTAYPRYQSAASISAFATTTADNQESFGTSESYDYEKEGGFMGSGGFVHFLDFSKSQTAIRRELDILKNNHWFDLNQGTLVLEMLFFNGNYEMFMHVSFIFEHDFSGLTSHYVIAQPLNMSFVNSGSGFYFAGRYLALLVMVVGFFGFLKIELDDMSSDPVAYLTNALQLIHFSSLMLSLVTVILWCALVYSYDYRSVRLPLPTDMNLKYQQFEDIVDLAHLAKIFSDVIAVNLCLIVVRCILLMANMTPFLSVIISTISAARYDLLAFIMVFMILFVGFTIAGYILCGTRSNDFSSFSRSLITCLKMVMGESNYEKLDQGDKLLGQPFWFIFHLFFIIIQNVLLSVIALAYYKERKKVDDPNAADRYPLKRFIKQVRTSFREWGRVIGGWIGTCWQFLFGSGSGTAIRVNFDQVNLYRDKRCSYRPKYRAIQYEAKQDEYASDVRKPDEDLKLRSKRPFYPGGLMNYYVDWVATDGLAGESGVKENYRLIGIQGQQGEPDPLKFRDEIKFYDKQELDKKGENIGGYGGEVSKILKFPEEHPPITLEFEGWVQPVSVDCIFNMIFVVVLSLFLAWSMRVSDCFYLTQVQKMTLFSPHWYAYNPTRIQNFTMLDGLRDVREWYAEAIIEEQYGCVTHASNPTACNNREDYLRDGWSLYAGPGGIVSAGPDLGMGFTPRAAEGLSLGYVPWSEVYGGDPTWQTNLQTVPRLFHWNVGFMVNNYVRSTMQVACFDENKEEKWKHGYPYILSPHIKHVAVGCATYDCMKKMVEGVEKGTDVCLDQNGKVRDPRVYTGMWSGVNYTFSKKGTYRELGGIAVGLGASKAEAETVSAILNQDQMMKSGFVNSIVIEFVAYNEHLDLFTYNSVLFSILATGKMKTEFNSIVFPLNVFSTGQQKSAANLRVLIYAFWVLTLACVLVFTIFFLRDLFIQYRITAELQKPKWSFITSFFSESWWNVLDLVTVVLNITAQYYLFRYIVLDSQINDWGWSSWTTKNFKFNHTVDEQRQDEFYNFSSAAYFYNEYVFFASWSILFVAIRSIKYMVAIQQLRLVVLTLSTAVWELLAMLLITFVALFAFACTFFVRYGNRYERFGNITDAFCELFIFMCGTFDIDDLYHSNPIFFTVVFPFVQLVFYFILANMFLAVTVYKWREVRKSAQEDVVSTLRSCWKSLSCIKRVTDKENEIDDNQTSLDARFWQGCAVLNYLSKFDDSGMIRGLDIKAPATGKMAGSGPDTTDGGADATGKENEDADGMALQQLEQSPIRDLEKIFKKAHMEIASQMCRNLPAPTQNQDEGAGMGSFLSEPPQNHYIEEESGDITIGIVEDLVEQGTAAKIKQDLEDKLKQEDPGASSVAQEIWLDALITVLEDVGALQKVQAFFLPPMMIRPRTQQEWGKFDEKKVKMEQRLDKFLRLLIEGTKTQHYKYLKDSAKTKEKVLKQQSLVFADYLDKLEQRIKELQQEIKVLERKNTEMRSHVAPLL